MSRVLMTSDPTPPIHSIVERRSDGTNWYRGTDGLWFCITQGVASDERLRWGQLAHGLGVAPLRIDGAHNAANQAAEAGPETGSLSQQDQ